MAKQSPQRLLPLLVLAAAGLAFLVIVISLLPQVGSRPVSPRGRCSFGLSEIGTALRQYHDDFGTYPPPYIADAKGRPIHSWRVLILPYLYQPALYRLYSFAEPWDGPNNIRLLKLMPDEFRCPASNSPKDASYTNYVAVVGEETVWNASHPHTFKDIKDDPKNTIMLVEIADSDIYWTQPRDLEFRTMTLAINKDRKGPSSNHDGGINVLYCGGQHVSFGGGIEKECGRVDFLPDTTSPNTLRALFTIHGNELVNVGP